jgi:hypothetical protein
MNLRTATRSQIRAGGPNPEIPTGINSVRGTPATGGVPSGLSQEELDEMADDPDADLYGGE